MLSFVHCYAYIDKTLASLVQEISNKLNILAFTRSVCNSLILLSCSLYFQCQSVYSFQLLIMISVFKNGSSIIQLLIMTSVSKSD